MNERNAGRRKKPDLEKRTKKVSFYLNDAEYETYLFLADKLLKSDYPISIKDYLRHCVLKVL